MVVVEVVVGMFVLFALLFYWDSDHGLVVGLCMGLAHLSLGYKHDGFGCRYFGITCVGLVGNCYWRTVAKIGYPVFVSFGLKWSMLKIDLFPFDFTELFPHFYISCFFFTIYCLACLNISFCTYLDLHNRHSNNLENILLFVILIFNFFSWFYLDDVW